MLAACLVALAAGASIRPAFAHGDMQVSVSNPASVQRGSEATFSIGLSSAGGETYAEAGYQLSVALPGNATFVSFSAAGSFAGWGCTTPAVGSSGNVTCTATSFFLYGTESFSLTINTGFDAATTREITAVLTNSDDPVLPNNSATGSVSVTDAPTTITLTSSANPSVTNQPVSFTATVTSGGLPVNCGGCTIQFNEEFSTFGTATADGNGVAVLDHTFTTPSGVILAAYFPGSPGYAPSTSNLVTQNVNEPQISISPTMLPDGFKNAPYSQLITASSTPPGTFTFTLYGGTLPSGVTLDPNGTLAGTPTQGGSFNFGVSARDEFDNQAIRAYTVVIGGGGTLIALVANAPNTVFGQTASFTATVTASFGTTIPTGSVEFLRNTTLLGTATLDGSGQATFDTTELPVGSSNIVARYVGDADFDAGAQAGLSHVVGPAATVTDLSASASSSTFGDTVTFTATVSAVAPGGGVPQGSVEFKDGFTVIGTEALDGSGQAVMSTSALLVGSHSITATYAVFDNHDGSTSSPAVHEVTAGSLVVELTASSATIGYGQTLDLTATANRPGGLVSGTMTIVSDVDGTIASGGTDGAGQLIASTSGLSAGNHQLTATFADGVDSASSVPVSVSVATATPTLTLTVNPVSSVRGQEVTITATVTGDGPTAPTGTVDFFIQASPTIPLTVPLSGSSASTTFAFPVVSSGYQISASYSGDANYGQANANATHDVTPATAAIAVSSSPNPSKLGQPVTFTANVSVEAPGGGEPNGPVGDKIIFFIDGFLHDADSFCCGTATLTMTDLAIGNHTVYAYLESTDYQAPQSASIVHTVGANETVTTLAVSPTDPIYGEDINFTVTVAPAEGGGSTPTGEVIVEVEGQSIGAQGLDGAGQATFSTGGLSPGDYSAVARYQGASEFLASDSDPASIAVQPDNVDVAVSISPSPSFFGQEVTVTATVTPQNGQTTPTGTVIFVSNGDPVYVELSGGTASFTTSSLPVGIEEFSVGYPGDANYLFGFSDDVEHEVLPDQTTTTLASSLNPSTAGESVTFTATVAGTYSSDAPGGTVTFSIDDVPQPPIVIEGQSVTLTTASLPSGSHSISAEYNGSEGFGRSSAVLAQQVNANATTTTLTSSENPSAAGEEVTFTAVVSSATGTPQGSVVFNVDGNATVVALVGGGIATLTTSTLEAGDYTVEASYNGSVDFEPSTADPIVQTVDHNIGITVTTLASSLNPSTVGAEVTFTATVSSAAGTPDGLVHFSIDGDVYSSVALAGGVASLSTSALGAGDHTVVASYNGNADFATSASEPLTQQVEVIATATLVSSSANPSTVGAPVVFTATVSSAGATPEGEVVFIIDGAAQQPSVSLAGGAASFATSALGAGYHTVVAAYGGTADFAASTSDPLTQQIEQAETATAVASSLNPSPEGAAVTFTATVSSGGGTPDGSVTFTIDGVAQTPVALTGGTATLAAASLASGTHEIAASYGGSTDFAPSSSAALSQQVEGSATSTSLSSSANPSATGEAVTFTATVSSRDGTPDGSVTFVIDKVPTVVPLEGGAATLTTAALAAGTYRVQAYYRGSDQFGPSTAQPVLQTVVPGIVETVTTLASNLNPSTAGEAVTFTATVSSIGGTPDGSVTLTIDGVAQTPVALAGGVAALTATSLPTGAHEIIASYSGNAAFEASTSSPLSQQVDQRSTTTTLSSSVNPSTAGQPVTITATVGSTSGTPDGEVVFSVDGVAQTPVALAGGVATFAASLATGTHQIVAIYGGSSTFAASTSAALPQQVNRRATTAAVTSSVNPSLVGDPVTFTATVTGDGSPDGEIVFSIDGVAQTPVALAGGVATFAAATLAAGTHQVVASYGGNADFAVSVSAALSQQVDQAATTTALSSSANPSTAGDSVTFTATVSSAGGTPDGEVVFGIDGTAQAPVALAGGVAILVTPALGGGAHQIVAAYGGGSTFAASTSAVLSQQVDRRATAVVVTSLVNPSMAGDPVTFTAMVTGDGSPSGDVVFTIDGDEQAPITLAGGIATLTTEDLDAGDHEISARYGGSPLHAVSQSEVLVQAVETSPDSRRLGEVQVQITKMVAQTSGQAISGAIDGAVTDGLSGGGALISGSPGMVAFNLVRPEVARKESPEQALDGLVGEGKLADRARVSVDSAFGHASGTHPQSMALPDPQRWSVWARVQNTAWQAPPEKASVEGYQINFLAGVGYRITPNFLVGAFAGYETFDYSSQPLNGGLEGGGWTVGGYVGWKILPALRFDAGIARSELDYDARAGAASATFGGERWLAQSGLTGSLAMGGFQIEPSARVYALWERENAYIDSLGGAHDARSFSTARASGGIKVMYPFESGNGLTWSPYVGLFADYYFSHDDAAAGLTFEDVISDGLSARFTAGFSLDIGDGAQISLGGELGGLGEGGAPHGTVRGGLRVRF